jgi:hypothetical protein
MFLNLEQAVAAWCARDGKQAAPDAPRGIVH